MKTALGAVIFVIGVGLLTAALGQTTPKMTAKKPRVWRTMQENGRWWLVTPDGKRQFSMGVDVVDEGIEKSEYRTDKPAYSTLRHYPTAEAWGKATQTRLKQWNFNTLGAWSSPAARQGALPYTLELELGGSTRVPWSDLFDPAIEKQFNDIARKQILPVRDDPNLLGYFTDNELGWWDDTMFLFFLQEKPENATRQMLLTLLRTHYKNNFDLLKQDFETGGAQSFDDLDKKANLTLRPGGDGMHVINEFVFRMADRYYKLAHDAVRRVDSNHLILGSRYAGWYPQAVVRAAGRWVDVISTNYGADWTDGTNARFALETLHRLTNKPVLIGEYYFCATQNASGNKNTGAIFPTVPTQIERTAGFRTQTSAFARLPWLVGAHWFQFYDEPAFGRGDGEDYNMGLVDIHDRPYPALTAAAKSLDTRALHQTSLAEPDAARFAVPPRIVKPGAHLLSWDKARTYVGRGAGLDGALPFADIYAAWTPSGLSLGLYTTDFLEEKLYADNTVPESERMEWIVEIGDAAPIHVRLGAGRKAMVSDSRVKFVEKSGLKSEIVLTIPAALLGKSRLQSGDAFTLRARLASHSRSERMAWRRPIRLAPH